MSAHAWHCLPLISEQLRVHRTPVMTDEDFSAMLEYCFTKPGQFTNIDAESSQPPAF
jgi:hypothetical protein